MSIVKGINVGLTDLTALYSDSNDKVNINITPIELYSVDGILPSIYTGEAQYPKPIVRSILDGKLSQPLTENIDYKLSYINNTNDGVATVIVEGIGNYKGSISKEWVIEKADIDVDIDGLGSISLYDGTNHAMNIDSSRVKTSGNQVYKIKYGINSGEYEYDVCPSVINVNDSKVIYFKISAEHHNDIEGFYEVMITPKTAELQWGESSWMYDGKVHSTTCEVSNLIGNDKCDVNILYNSITNIGSIDVYASSLSNSNYILPSEGLWYTITITPGMFIKQSGVWIPVKSVYRKIGGSWVMQDINSALSTSEKYVEKFT